MYIENIQVNVGLKIYQIHQNGFTKTLIALKINKKVLPIKLRMGA